MVKHGTFTGTPRLPPASPYGGTPRFTLIFWFLEELGNVISYTTAVNRG